jgi:hypothetical protein
MRQDLEDSRYEYFDRQQSLYDQVKPELIQKYLGEFVAFEDGVVLDHDQCELDLLQRVYTKYGYRDLLIKQVWAVEPQLSVNSISHFAGAK